MRGEHLAKTSSLFSIGGSSPHARGARRQYVDTETTMGIIPACAGSTLACGADCAVDRDHPRMRGEH